MKRLFVTGASGFLGSNIIKNISKEYDVYGSYYKHKVNFKKCKCSLLQIDLTQEKQLDVINEINPNLILHCAAFTNVDKCEKYPKDAYIQNVIATENITKIAEENNSFLIHISTDMVFDGKKGNYSEKDRTNPINVYGKTKLDAEKMVEKVKVDYCIVRTNIYGWNKRNKLSLAEWMINKFETNDVFPAFYDVKFSPIFTNNLARALFEIYEKKICGILNVSGSNSCTKFEFAETIADVFGFDKKLIEKTSINELCLTAKRGENLSLSVKKSQKLLDTKLLNIKEGLQEMKRLKDEGYVKELKGK